VRKVLIAATVLCMVGAAAARGQGQEALYLRFKPLSADGVYATLSTNIHRPPWRVSYADMPRGGRNYPRVRVRRGQYSPWAKLAPDWCTINLSFFNPEPLPRVEVEVQLAREPREESVFRTLRVREVGHMVGIALPRDYRDHPEGIMTVREASERHLQMAQGLGLSREGLPRRFSFFAGAHRGHYTDWQIWKNEMQTLRILGINGTSYPGSEEALAICKELGFSRFIAVNWMANPQTAGRQKALSDEAFGNAP